MSAPWKEGLRSEAENGGALARRVEELAAENHRLSTLYVASYQLHASLELDEVLRVICEILINLIGAERFAIHLLDEATGELAAVAGDARDLASYPRWRLGEGSVGRAVAEGRRLHAEGSVAEGEPLVCVPLAVGQRTVGAIVLYRLLGQKPRLSELDEELFALLAGHAATALLAARLHGESLRKLHTVRGFLDLLTR